MTRRNRYAGMAAAWGVVSLAGIAAMVAPWIAEVGSGWDAPAMFAGGVLALGGAALATLSGVRARIVARLFADGGALLRWAYPQAIREDAIARALDERRRRNRALGRVAAIGCAALAFLFAAIRPSDRGLIFAVLLTALVAVAVLTKVEPLVWRARQLRGVGEAYVSLEAAYVLGTLHAWSLCGAYVADAGVVPSAMTALRVAYVTPLRPGREDVVALIPIPPGEEGRASEVARALAARAEALSARM
jgi:hypothetical protein